MSNGKETGIFGQPIRWYIDQAEWPLVGLALAYIVGFISSYWIEAPYLDIVAPLSLVFQLVAAVATAYLTGVHGGAGLKPTLVTCFLVGLAGGIVSAVLSFIRFFYAWLLFNIITEPVWSGLMAAAVGSITIAFFNLPKLVKQRETT